MNTLTTTGADEPLRKKHTGEPGNGGQFGTDRKQSSGLRLNPEQTRHIERLLAHADHSAAVLARKMRGGQGWDHEDLAQDVKMEIIARAKRTGRVDDMTEAWVRYYTNGLIARVAEVTRQGRSPSEHYRARHESMAAFRDFRAAVTEREEALGHALSGQEKDAIAEDIRERWPDKNHRPPAGFHQTVYVDTFETSDDDDRGVRTGVRQGSGTAPSAEDIYLATGGRDWADVETLPAVQKAMSAGSAAAAKKFAWRAIAQMNGLPNTVVRLNNRQVAKIRTEVGSSDADVRAAIDEWRHGQDTPRVQEFFRPFGADSDGHREQVVEVFDRMSDRSEELFAAAVAGATARNFS